MINISVVPLAYLLDLILGDPRWLPHPVKGIGWLIKKLELPIRKLFTNEYITGTIFAFVIVFIPTAFTWYIIYSANSLNIFIGLVISIVVIYTTISIKDLKVETMEVYNALEKKDLVMARRKLSMVVGRDTENLDETEIIRATVETIAESTVDGIISPIFYAFLGGPVLAMAYKAINTLDSMIGYENKQYKKFGWMAAKIDTVVNFIPAVLSLMLIPLASLLCGKNFLSSLRIVFRDGVKAKHINSSIPEAAIAGALGIQLGGINFYNGIPVAKEFLGDKNNLLSLRTIKEAVKISYMTSFLAVSIPTLMILL